MGFFEELCLFSVEHAVIQSVSGLMLGGLGCTLGVSSTVSFGGQRSPYELTVLASRPLEKHMVHAKALLSPSYAHVCHSQYRGKFPKQHPGTTGVVTVSSGSEVT